MAPVPFTDSEPRLEKTEGTGERVGDYRVVRRLATGGTSDVLLAKSDIGGAPDELVVLKILLTKYEHDADLKAMFTREAGLYARLRHPSIVSIHDYFPNGERLVMVLDYVDGPPLGRLRGMLKTVGQPIDDIAALHLAACVFDALAMAHAACDENGDSAPIVHRDVNPSNILVSWDGLVKLADFGIAKVLGTEEQSVIGSIKGTYGYMAPEQVRGEAVTPRADVYAAAIVLWELLTKRRAFLRGALPELEVLRALADPHIVPLDVLRPDLDPRLREAMKRALEPNVDRRNITAEELAGTLRATVPVDQGRSRLESLLSYVRHEPRTSPTSAPPPPHDAGEEETAKFFTKDIPRSTAAYDAPPRPAAGARPRFQSMSPDEVDNVLGRSGENPTVSGIASSTETAKLAALSSLANPLGAAVGPGSLKDSIDEILGDISSRPRPALEALRSAAESRPDLPPPSSRGAEPRFMDSDSGERTIERAPDGGLDHTLVLGRLPEAPPALDPLRRDLNAPPLPPASTPPSAPTDGSLRRPDLRADRGDIGGDDVSSDPYPSSFPAMSRTLAMSFAPAAASRLGRQPVPMSLPPLESDSAVDARASLRPAAPEPAQGGRSMPPRPVPRPGGTPPAPPVAQKTATAPMPARAPSSPALHATSPMLARTGSSPNLDPPTPLVPSPVQPPPDDAHPATAKMPAIVVAPPSPATAPIGEMSATLPLTSSTDSAPPPRAQAPSAPPHVPPSQMQVPPSSRPREPIPYFQSDPHFVKKRSLAVPFIVLALVGAALGGGGYGYARWRRAAAMRVTIPTATTSAPVAPATATSAESTATASASASVAVVVASASPSASPSASVASSASSASPSASALASAAPSASVVASGSASALPSASASAPAGDVPAGMGRVKTADAKPGHRVFVDDKTVGQTPDAVLVKCGSRKIRVGSAGSVQTVDVPCGAEISVGDR